MSADTVDDLHAAEDTATALTAVLEELLELTREPDVNRAITETLQARRTPHLAERWTETRKVAIRRVNGWNDYCRPTCGANGDPDSDECTDETCGCPCAHMEMDAS